MNKPYVHESGYWLSGEEGHFSKEEGYFFDVALAGELTLLLEGMSVCDIGCGLGRYVRWLRDRGFDCDGYDGNPNTRELTDGICDTLNFAEPVRLSRTYDAIMSFEVGEHIPAQFEQSFIDNLASHARKLLVMSWAVPGQEGDGHVNCRSNLHIVRQLRRRGFRFEPIPSLMLRANCSLYWLKHTLLVFSRRRSTYSRSERRALLRILGGDWERLKLNNRSNSTLLHAAMGKLARTISTIGSNRLALANRRRLLAFNSSMHDFGATAPIANSAGLFFPICFTSASDFSFLELSLLSLSRIAPSVKEVHIFSDPSDPLSSAQMDRLSEIGGVSLVFKRAKYPASIGGPVSLLNELDAWTHVLPRMPDRAYLMKFTTDTIFISARIFQTVAQCDRAIIAVTVPEGRACERPGEQSYFVRARELRQVKLQIPADEQPHSALVIAQLVAETLTREEGQRLGGEATADNFGFDAKGIETAAAVVRRLSATSSLLSFRDAQSQIVNKAKMKLAAEVVLGSLPPAPNPYSEIRA